MNHKDTERSLGIMVGLATAGLTFFELVGCASSPSSPVVADASLDRAADSSVSVDAPSVRDTSEAASLCTGPAAEALIVSQDNVSGPAVPFDFCIYQLSLLPKSDVPVLDGGAQEAG
jgi:hypothetical protein